MHLNRLCCNVIRTKQGSGRNNSPRWIKKLATVAGVRLGGTPISFGAADLRAMAEARKSLVCGDVSEPQLGEDADVRRTGGALRAGSARGVPLPEVRLDRG